MSTNPHPEGVADVVAMLRDIELLEVEVAELRPKAKRLVEAEKQIAEERTKLAERLRAMDLESPGNYGWEGRMGWFVAEMRRQIIAVQRRGGR